MSKSRRTRNYSVTYVRAAMRAEKEAQMNPNDTKTGPRLLSKSANKGHIALVDMLAETLKLTRLEVIQRAVRLLAAEVEREATTKGEATHAT